MLIEFRVENHRSIRDEQVFTLETDHGPDSDDQCPRVVGHEKPLLPVAALYGANASGKSNLLAAMAFMRTAIIDSHRLWPPDGGVPRDPYAWGPKRTEPSLFEVTFLLTGVRYQYGFLADDQTFLEEWLHAWPHSRKQVLFQREEGNKFEYGEHLKGQNRLIESATRPNALFLSSAVQNKHPQLSEIFAWFRLMQTLNLSMSSLNSTLVRTLGNSRAWFTNLFDGRFQASLFDETEGVSDQFRALLRNADVGIVDLKTERTESGRSRLLVKHETPFEDSWLPLEEESGGTKTLFKLATPLLRTLEAGGVLVADELEASLHPCLAQYIVRMFNDPKINDRNAQLVFSTHDTNLLGTTVGEPALRRDQVWLTEKDKEGATKVYPLTDYKPRNVENLERGYLQGRYGAIPALGNFFTLDK